MGQAPDQEDPAYLALALFQEREHLAGHAVVQGPENVLGRGLVAVELVGDVGLAVHRAARGERDDLSGAGATDRLVQAEAHAAYLLDEKLAASGGALVVGEDVRDLAAGEDVDEERLAPQRSHGVVGFPGLAKRALDGGDLGDMAERSGHSEEFAV